MYLFSPVASDSFEGNLVRVALAVNPRLIMKVEMSWSARTTLLSVSTITIIIARRTRACFILLSHYYFSLLLSYASRCVC